MAILVSVLLLVAGLGIFYVTIRILSGLSKSLMDSIRPWICITSLLCLVVAAFFIAVTVSDIGVLAVFIGAGVALIVWGTTTLGVVWNYAVGQAAEKKLHRLLSRDPDMADRFYSSRWLRWLMPKRKR